MKQAISILLCLIAICILGACNKQKTEKANPEADSLQSLLNSKTAEMDEMNLFLDAVNASMDSIVYMDGQIVKTTGESRKSVKEQIKDNLLSFKLTLDRQRERLAILMKGQKSGAIKMSPKMLQTIEALKRQVAEKDSAIAELQEQLKKRDFDIQALQANVKKLNGNVTELTEKNKQQAAELKAQTDLMNEAYYFIGTRRDLRDAGIISGGSFFRKTKLTMSDACAHAFRKIDIRDIDQFTIPGKHPQVLTQEPANSYTITKNGDGTCTLTITDPAKFWYYTNYLVIKY